MHKKPNLKKSAVTKESLLIKHNSPLYDEAAQRSSHEGQHITSYKNKWNINIKISPVSLSPATS
jgi:hypothetical protein